MRSQPLTGSCSSLPSSDQIPSGQSNVDQIAAFNACLGSNPRSVSDTAIKTATAPATAASSTPEEPTSCDHAQLDDGCSEPTQGEDITAKVIDSLTTIATEIVRGITSVANTLLSSLVSIAPSLLKAAVSLIPGLGMLVGK